MGSKILHLNQWELCSSHVWNFAIAIVCRNEDNGILVMVLTRCILMLFGFALNFIAWCGTKYKHNEQCYRFLHPTSQTGTLLRAHLCPGISHSKRKIIPKIATIQFLSVRSILTTEKKPPYGVETLMQKGKRNTGKKMLTEHKRNGNERFETMFLSLCKWAVHASRPNSELNWNNTRLRVHTSAI